MPNVIIKGMEMPKGCHSCPIGNHIGLYVVQCPITKSKIDGCTEIIRLSDCPLRPAPEWISVEERLPEPFVSALIYVPDQNPLPPVMEGYIDGIGRFHAVRIGIGVVTVTHWMPLPEPPGR